MENIKIKISKETRRITYISKKKIGNDGENLQGNLVFSFEDEFVDGQARIEAIINGTKAYQVLTKEEETYKIPIKSVLTKCGILQAQIVITEGTNVEEIPIFKSDTFELIVDESVNAVEEAPDEYPQWIELANVKLSQMDTLNLDANKEGKITAIVITRKDGTQKIVQVLDGIDGIGLNYNWSGTSLGVKREDETTYEYTNLKGDKGDPGSVKFKIVEQLPTTGIEEDAIYLVPITPDEQDNNFKEYIYVNGSWELLSKIAVHVDLSDYYTKEQVNALIPDVSNFITKDVNNLTYYYTKTQIDSMIGDISNAIDLINGEIV